MIALPQDVAFIIHKIEKAGFEAFAVGGCIRDSLLSRIPNDWDITTSALPEQVKALFHIRSIQGSSMGRLQSCVTMSVMR